MLSVTYTIVGSPAVTVSFSDTTPAAEQTATIQVALDAVQAGGGGTVTLSAGTFSVTGSGIAADGALRVGSDTTLQGAGMGETVVKLAANSGSVTGIVRTDSGQTLADGTIKATENVVIRDITIDGNRANNTGTVDGFYSGPKPGYDEVDSNITLDAVEIREVSRYGFDPHEGTVNLTITNSVAHDNGMDGFTIDGSINVTLADNVAYDNGRHGFNIVTGSEDVRLSDNQAYGNGGSGLVIQTGDNEVRTWTSNVTVSGGSYSDNARSGIEVRQATDVVIEGVEITGNGRQGIVLLGVENVALADNTVSGNAGTPQIRIDGYMQDFGDSDPLNDRYIATHNVTIDGVAIADPVVPPGATVYSYVVTTGSDVIDGSAGRDAIAAGRGNDVVRGNAGDDVLFGNGGNDTLDGGAGNDALHGNAGDDRLRYTGGGVDTMDGGSGYDTIDFSGFGSAVRVDLGAGGHDVFTSSTATATATDANATIAIVDIVGAEEILATAFNDIMRGNGSANRLGGGAGNDTISGNGGNDTLTGGAGNDILNGGTGSDRFVFAAQWGADTIQDFQRGKDKVVFEAGTGPASFAELQIAGAGGSALVSWGGNSILLTGVQANKLGAADFLFE